jgi:hypothetical protein
MNSKSLVHNGKKVIIVKATQPIIKDVQSAIDFVSTIRYEHDCDRIALNKAGIVEEFFDLRTRMAGDIFQKFVNYQIKFAIIGNFSEYKSKALQDFIYETNKGNHIFFVADENEAITQLAK